ncbi:MAG: malto-oligosyltrehalose trehalohydrolase, partial [Acidobacteria bacterium]|nr:malto-oligosyltrehalose trehalohydrolase [Acidobacteriota bacterium]
MADQPDSDPFPNRTGVGAHDLGGGKCRFRVWSPESQRVEVCILGSHPRRVPLSPEERGYHVGILEGVSPGERYKIRLDEGPERPDPASRFQPDGVHGASQVLSRAFDWQDGGWKGVPLDRYVIYELHIGTFTPEGTFDAVFPHLADLKDLGITAIEIMPVAQFPGSRNWGYDGAFPFAVQNSYGGPDGLRRLVDACHRNGLAVVLDVVYN